MIRTMIAEEMTMKIRINHRIRAVIFLALVNLGAFAIAITAQSDPNYTEWSKTKEEREQRMLVAERESYVIRHINFNGNMWVRDRDMRRRLDRHFSQGDIFQRKLLENSIRNLSKMHAIFPVTMNDVVVRLDSKDKNIELTFNVRERQSLSQPNDHACGQAKTEQDPLVVEAARDQYIYRRIEIVGNTYTRYREFRRRFANFFNEGDIFTKKALEDSVRRVSKMKTIYPIRMENIEIRLDRENKVVDIVFCVKQRPKKDQL